MIDKTFDALDPRDLPYRFSYDPVTGEWFILSVLREFNVLGYFGNTPSFNRFLIQGMRAYDEVQSGILKEAADILRDKQLGGA